MHSCYQFRYSDRHSKTLDHKFTFSSSKYTIEGLQSTPWRGKRQRRGGHVGKANEEPFVIVLHDRTRKLSLQFWNTCSCNSFQLTLQSPRHPETDNNVDNLFSSLFSSLFQKYFWHFFNFFKVSPSAPPWSLLPGPIAIDHSTRWVACTTELSSFSKMVPRDTETWPSLPKLGHCRKCCAVNDSSCAVIYVWGAII